MNEIESWTETVLAGIGLLLTLAGGTSLLFLTHHLTT